ncbi:MAG TPA: dUTP diphosphatase [Desulfobulbaceae bacterium]|nr:dUTP diphosphatase [Desulfobulbaceae bacterium]
MEPIRFLWLRDEPPLPPPAYQSEGASGLDLASAEEALLAPGEIRLLSSGYAVAIPAGYEIQVRPRSGLAIRHGITLINSPGTIDSDYRGEIMIGLVNFGQAPYTVARGERVCQLVVMPVARATVEVVTMLEATTRGAGGFGHTGRF